MNSNKLSIVFVGSHDRGKRLRKAVGSMDWKINVVTNLTPGLAENSFLRSDLVILDNFPDSNLAKTIFFHLRSIDAGPFLSLNDLPHALKFLHLHALSFIRIIDRDPEPKHLIKAIIDLVESYRKTHSTKPVRRDVRGNLREDRTDRCSSPQRIMKHRQRQISLKGTIG